MTVDGSELSVPAENQMLLSASLRVDLVPVRGAEGCTRSHASRFLMAKGVLEPDLQMCKPPGFQRAAVLKDFPVHAEFGRGLALSPPEYSRVKVVKCLGPRSEAKTPGFCLDLCHRHCCQVAGQAMSPSLTSPPQAEEDRLVHIVILWGCFESDKSCLIIILLTIIVLLF